MSVTSRESNRSRPAAPAPLLPSAPAAHPGVWALVLGGIALLLVAAWLFLPHRASPDADAAPAVRVCLVDASASVRRVRPRWWLPWVRSQLVEESRRADLAEQEIAVVVFASGARVCFGPGEPSALRDQIVGRGAPPFDPVAGIERDSASDLARALFLARSLALDPDRRIGEILLLGEGTFTGEDPGRWRAELRSAGVPLRIASPPPRELGDLALRSLRLPPIAEAGAPLRAVVEYEWIPGGATGETARLSIELESGGTVIPELRLLELPREGGCREVALDLGPAEFGRNELRVRAIVESGPDPVRENDSVRATCLVEGTRVVGVVAGQSSREAAREWLVPSGTSALPGLQFLFLEPEELAGLLGELDVLVSFDLPLARLPERLLDHFVGSGGGWLATSGWGFRTDWIPGLDPAGLHRLLPATPAPLEQGPRDVVLLIDGSGSMSGDPFETLRAATLDLVAAALPSDRVSLRFFTEALERERVIKERRGLEEERGDEGAEAARRLLGARVPGGRTFLFDSLRQFATVREGSGVPCLTLLLTDGRETDALSLEAKEERAAEVSRRLRAAHTDLVVIGVGEQMEEEILLLLGRPGEEVVRAENLSDLQAIFRREIAGSQIREGEAIAVLRAPLPDRGVTSLAREALGGLTDESDPPPLSICLRNRLREGGEALWITDEGEPVLAVQRVGRGRTALFASNPHPEWARLWTGRFGSGEPRHFAPLLRWLGRDRSSRAMERARIEGETLIVEGLGEGWPAELRGWVLDSTGEGERGADSGVPILLAPPASAAGLDPRSRRWGSLPPGFHERFAGLPVAVLLERGASSEGGEPADSLLLPLDLGPGPEFAGGEGRIVFEGPLAGSTSEGIEEDRNDRELRGRGRGRARAPLVALLGVLLLFSGALFRRAGGSRRRANGQGRSADDR
jgi:hypothetical protein